MAEEVGGQAAESEGALRQCSKSRLIFDLRGLNAAGSEATFAMETVFDVPAFVANAVCGAKLDLRSAFLQIPIHPASQPFFGCRAPDGSLAAWRVMPFGWCQAPRVFSAITSAFVRAWRAVGVSVFAYIDDLLVVGSCVDELLRSLAIVVTDLVEAGVRISAEKAFVRPHLRLPFLGVVVDFAAKAFALPRKKLQRMSEGAKFLAEGGREAATLETLLGRAAFAAIVEPMSAFWRPALQRWLADAVGGLLPEPTADVRGELDYWERIAPTRMSRLRPWGRFPRARVWASRLGEAERPVLEQRQDASSSGIGVTYCLGGREFTWSEPLPADLIEGSVTGRHSSSTAREVYAVARGIERLPEEEVPPGSTVLVLCDNMAAVAVANARGCTQGTAWAARRLQEAVDRRGLVLIAEWVPRALLEREDAASRADAQSAAHARVPSEYLRRMSRQMWGVDGPAIDLFAAPHNAVAETFGSRWPAPGSAGDALALDWHGLRQAWAYPPFVLIRECLLKAIACPAPPDVAFLLPDSFFARRCLWAHRILPGPDVVLMPPHFVRGVHVPLVLFAPPQGRPGEGSVPG